MHIKGPRFSSPQGLRVSLKYLFGFPYCYSVRFAHHGRAVLRRVPQDVQNGGWLQSSLSYPPISFIELLSMSSKHVKDKHGKYLCQTCPRNRKFRTQQALESHYKGSAEHPSCTRCGNGFLDEISYEYVCLSLISLIRSSLRFNQSTLY